MKKKFIGNQKDINYDKFYTKQEVVKKVLKSINLNNFDLIIEPSAGAGAFSMKLPSNKTIAMDIQPESNSILQRNYFEYIIKEKYDNVLVIGNPPFGKNNILSKNFLKHSFSFPNVKMVAFILPNLYKKHSRQNIIPDNFKITKIIDLPINSFTVSGGEHHVPCSFFIFERDSRKKDLRQIKRIETNDFKFVSRSSKYDFFIFGAAPRKILKKANENNRGYFIKSKIDVEELKRNFKKIKWIGHSGVNGGIYWLTTTDIIENYERDIHGIKSIK